MGPAGVHAVARSHQAVVGHDVRGGHPQLAAALVAVHHLALEQERAAEEPRGVAHLAGRHQAADLAGGHGLAANVNERHHPRLELVI